MSDDGIKSKTPDEHWMDWEMWAFGYGYGSGEAHIIPALRKFLELCPDSKDSTLYDYRVLEKELTPTVAWLLINRLCEVGIIEYGTSPRCGWLDYRGKVLKAYIASKTDDELYNLATDRDDHIHCSPDACNCGPRGFTPGRKCPNPFWLKT